MRLWLLVEHDHTFVWCSFQLEGFHNWPDAHIEAYLASKHRHMFHFRVQLEVTKSAREVEFITLKREVSTWLTNVYGRPCMFGALSCEEIAHIIKDVLIEKFGERYYIISVAEDNENGAEILHVHK